MRWRKSGGGESTRRKWGSEVVCCRRDDSAATIVAEVSSTDVSQEATQREMRIDGGMNGCHF